VAWFAFSENNYTLIPICHPFSFYNTTQHTITLASYLGLLVPAFVAYNTNAGEGLVKLSHVVWHLDVWRSGTFLLYSCKAAFWI